MEGPTKIERLIDWLKENEIRDAVLLGDSWYTNSHVIESCKLWFGITFIGKVRGNLYSRQRTLSSEYPLTRTLFMISQRRLS
jgi:hypothetical protein